MGCGPRRTNEVISFGIQSSFSRHPRFHTWWMIHLYNGFYPDAFSIIKGKLVMYASEKKLGNLFWDPILFFEVSMLLYKSFYFKSSKWNIVLFIYIRELLQGLGKIFRYKVQSLIEYSEVLNIPWMRLYFLIQVFYPTSTRSYFVLNTIWTFPVWSQHTYSWFFGRQKHLSMYHIIYSEGPLLESCVLITSHLPLVCS